MRKQTNPNLLKNVLKGLNANYELKEINIITDSLDRVIFSGAFQNWSKIEDIAMYQYKKHLEGCTVTNRIIFNNKKAFLFIAYIPFVTASGSQI